MQFNGINNTGSEENYLSKAKFIVVSLFWYLFEYIRN